MPNSTNNEWVEPTNIPKSIKDIGFNDEIFGEVIDALEDITTLNDAQSAVDGIFEQYAFLKEL